LLLYNYIICFPLNLKETQIKEGGGASMKSLNIDEIIEYLHVRDVGQYLRVRDGGQYNKGKMALRVSYLLT